MRIVKKVWQCVRGLKFGIVYLFYAGKNNTTDLGKYAYMYYIWTNMKLAPTGRTLQILCLESSHKKNCYIMLHVTIAKETFCCRTHLSNLHQLVQNKSGKSMFLNLPHFLHHRWSEKIVGKPLKQEFKKGAGLEVILSQKSSLSDLVISDYQSENHCTVNGLPYPM